MYFLKKMIIILFIMSISSCNEKTYNSGKILNLKENYDNFKYKSELIKNLGLPNYTDLIENKYYYFKEQIVHKNVLNRKISNRLILVYSFENEKIISFNKYDLNDKKDIKLIKKNTQNEIIKQGFIEKVFGGVGTNPNSTNASQ